MSCHGCYREDVYVIEPKKAGTIRSWWVRGFTTQIHFCPFCGYSLDVGSPETKAHGWIITDSEGQIFRTTAQTAYAAWKACGTTDGFNQCSFAKEEEE